MPGVKAFFEINGAGKELYYAGDEVIAVAAETEDQCRDALRAIKVVYTPLEFVVKEGEALAKPNLKTVSGTPRATSAFPPKRPRATSTKASSRLNRWSLRNTACR